VSVLPGERLRMRGRSLRLKLTVWFVLVFLLLQAALLTAVVLLRRDTIRQSLQGQLARSAGSMVDSILAEGLELTSEEIQHRIPTGSGFLLFAIRDGEGKVLSSWNVPDPANLPFSAWEIVPAGPVGAVFTTLGPERAGRLAAGEQRLQLVTLPFRTGEELYFFQAVVRDQDLWSLLGPLDMIVLAIPLGLVVVTIAAWMIGGRAVAPIQRLSRAVEQLSPRSLDSRFKVSSNDAEVSRLEDELNSALERLEEGYGAQAQFISNVSHELKTPIAVLLTRSQVAKLGERGQEERAFVDLVEREMKRLANLVESLLVLARTDMNKNRPGDPTSVNDLVLEAVQHCRLVAEQSKVRLVPKLVEDEGEGPMVSGDPQLLQVMVENLVRNAIRHSPKGRQVSIAAERWGNEVKIAVSDSGPGIPHDYLDRVFERGVRVPPQNGQPDPGTGSGLGLAIARNVAQLHRGQIGVHNRSEGGCSFEVTLPLVS